MASGDITITRPNEVKESALPADVDDAPLMRKTRDIARHRH